MEEDTKSKAVQKIEDEDRENTPELLYSEIESSDEEEMNNLYSDIDSTDDMMEEDDWGQGKRVLHFRRSKFSNSRETQHHMSKKRWSLLYKQACAKAGLPELPNEEPYATEQTLTLSDRVELPRKGSRKCYLNLGVK